MAAPHGFEPRLTESESAVLPLDDGAIDRNKKRYIPIKNKMQILFLFFSNQQRPDFPLLGIIDLTTKVPANTLVNNQALSFFWGQMSETLKNTYTLIKNNLGLFLSSILMFRLFYEINSIPFPIYRNILYAIAVSIWTSFMIRRLLKLKLFNPEVYIAGIFYTVMYFILWVLAEILIILILFLPAELMFFKFWNFQEWQHFVFSKFLFNTFFMNFVKSTVLITSFFFSSLFLIKLIGIAAGNEITFQHLMKQSMQLILLAILLAILFYLPAEKLLTPFYLIIIISTAFTTFQKVAVNTLSNP